MSGIHGSEPFPNLAHEQRAHRARGKGRWVIENMTPDGDGEDGDWRPTMWRGITLEVAIVEVKRLQEENDGLVFRIRDVDTDNFLLADVL